MPVIEEVEAPTASASAAIADVSDAVESSPAVQAAASTDQTAKEQPPPPPSSDAMKSEDAGSSPGEAEHQALAKAIDFKTRGNAHFQAKEYEQANLCYSHAIDLAPAQAPEVRLRT